MEEDMDLWNAPQASSRVLTHEETRQGLGTLARLPPELVAATLVGLGYDDLFKASQVSRALNEHALLELMKTLEVDSTRDDSTGLFVVVDRMARIGRLDVRSLYVYERDAALPPQFKIVLSQIAGKLRHLHWFGGFIRKPPNLPPMPVLGRLSLEWDGTLHLWDEADKTFFGRLLVEGTTRLEELRIVSSYDVGQETADLRAEGQALTLYMGGVLASQPLLHTLVVLNHHRPSDIRTPITITLGREMRTFPKLKILSLSGKRIVLDPIACRQLFSSTPDLASLTFDVGTPLDMQGVPALTLLSDFVGHANAIGPLSGVVENGQLASLRLSDVEYPSSDFEKMLHFHARDLSSLIEVADVEAFEEALAAVLRRSPELESLAMWCLVRNEDVSAGHWDRIFDNVAQFGLRLRRLELSSFSDFIALPEVVDAAWADRLFARAPELESFTVVAIANERRVFHRVSPTLHHPWHCVDTGAREALWR